MLRRFLTRSLHVSWIASFSCVGIVIGVIVSGMFDITFMATITWLLTGTGLVLFGLLRARNWVVVLVVLGGGLIGAWRGAIITNDSRAYKMFAYQTVELSGTVMEDTDIDKRGQTILRLRDISIDNIRTEGSVWVTTRYGGQIKRSDRVTVTGRSSDGFGSFNASVHAAKVIRIERPVPGDVALQVRDYFASSVRSGLSETQASLGLGYLVGQRRGLPEDLDAALQAAGLTHIVVASGYNLTILVRLARRLFERVSKYVATMSSMSMILGFIAITGLSPSMSRAGLVAGLSLLAWHYGHRFHPLVLLPLAMAVTLLIQPSYGWGDLGWQLSFAAFGGVMILAPLLQVYFFGDKPERTLRRIFVETMAATIATLPILIVSFSQYSIVAPVANMAILPLVPLAMLLTFLTGVAGLLVPFAVETIALPTQFLLTYMVSAAELFGGLPWAVQEAKLSPAGALVIYIVMAAVCVYIQRVTRYQLQHSSLVE